MRFYELWLLTESEHWIGPVYHGTRGISDFKFVPSHKGIYFSADRDYATTYADFPKTSGLITAHVRIENPFKVRMPPWNGAIVINDKIEGFYRELNRELIQKLRSLGYDGILAFADETLPSGRVPKNPFEVVVFDPSQIRIDYTVNA
jgi:hypothetical protein